MVNEIWTELVIEDLMSVHDYISKDTRVYADRFIEKIISRLEQLESFPRSGSIVPAFHNDDCAQFSALCCIVQRQRPREKNLIFVSYLKLVKMDTFIVHANSKVSKVLKAIFKALNVQYEIQKGQKIESPYDPEFVKMVLESRNSSNRRVLDEAYKKELFGDL